MNLKKILKDTGITLEIIYFLLLLIIIYYLYSICNNINKEYFTISANPGALHLSSQQQNDIHDKRCSDLFTMVQNEEDKNNLRPTDIYYLVNSCESFNELEGDMISELRNIASQVPPNSLKNLI